jgi:hypothetical protein
VNRLVTKTTDVFIWQTSSIVCIIDFGNSKRACAVKVILSEFFLTGLILSEFLLMGLEIESFVAA